MDEFTKHYLVAALWSACEDNDGNTLDSQYSIHDFSGEAIKKAEKDIAAFKEIVEKNLNEKLREEWESLDDKQTAHDLSLTRNRHGAGFWENDHTTPELGKILTDAAHSIGEINVYENNGKLEFE